MEERPGRRAPDNAAEVDARPCGRRGRRRRGARSGSRPPACRRRRAWPLARGRLAAGERRDPRVGGVDVGRGAEPLEQLGELRVAAQDGVLVRRPERHVAAPGLAAGAGRRRRRTRRAARSSVRRSRDGRRGRRARPRSDRHPPRASAARARRGRRRSPLRPRSCRRPWRHVRAGCARSRRIPRRRRGRATRRRRGRACLEQRTRQVRVVLDAGGAVERRHVAVLVGEEAVRVGAAREQPARELRRLEAGMARVEERRPAERPAGRVRVAVPAAAEQEPHPRVALELRPGGEEPLGPRRAPWVAARTTRGVASAAATSAVQLG